MTFLSNLLCQPLQFKRKRSMYGQPYRCVSNSNLRSFLFSFISCLWSQMHSSMKHVTLNSLSMLWMQMPWTHCLPRDILDHWATFFTSSAISFEALSSNYLKIWSMNYNQRVGSITTFDTRFVLDSNKDILNFFWTGRVPYPLVPGLIVVPLSMVSPAIPVYESLVAIFRNTLLADWQLFYFLKAAWICVPVLALRFWWKNIYDINRASAYLVSVLVGPLVKGILEIWVLIHIIIKWPLIIN